MKTRIGQELRFRFPELRISEDIYTESKYWVNIDLGRHSVVIENAGERGFGVSVIENGGLDFGGHDQVFDGPDKVIIYTTQRIEELTMNQH